MTQEQKEKAYDEALERASRLRVQNPFDTVSQMMEHVFPELKESEGERIRKEIYQFVYEQRPEADWLAWLEKQDKQDVRYKHLEELLAADDIYQMSMNQDMVEEAKTKAINALSKLCISELLLEKQGEQKPAWNEEDKNMLKKAIKLLDEFGGDRNSGAYTLQEMSCRDCADWLKSLKQRIITI